VDEQSADPKSADRLKTPSLVSEKGMRNTTNGGFMPDNKSAFGPKVVERNATQEDSSD
jgi:hypothetical protein